MKTTLNLNNYPMLKSISSFKEKVSYEEKQPSGPPILREKTVTRPGQYTATVLFKDRMPGEVEEFYFGGKLYKQFNAARPSNINDDKKNRIKQNKAVTGSEINIYKLFLKEITEAESIENRKPIDIKEEVESIKTEFPGLK